MLPSDREPAQGTTFYAAPPFISELPHESPYHDAMPSTSSVQQDGELLAWHDESTQTEWIYESKLGKGSCPLLAVTQGAGGGMHSVRAKERGSRIAPHADDRYFFPCHSIWYFREKVKLLY